jgi:hypothetical protein
VGFEGVHYANGYWVAVGLSGTLYYKLTDPTGAWTQNNLSPAISNRDVFYGDGRWVVVGSGLIGYMWYRDSDPTGAFTSNDQRTSSFFSVTNANGEWYGSGSVGNVHNAIDETGVWIYTPQGSKTLERVAYANGYWVAVGAGGTIWYLASAELFDAALGAGAWIEAPDLQIAE